MHGALFNNVIYSKQQCSVKNNIVSWSKSSGLEFKAESPTLVVGVHAATSALKLDHTLTCGGSHLDAKSLQLRGAVLLPCRQRRWLVGWDDHGWRWWFGQFVVDEVCLSAFNDRLEQLATGLGTRQHVVAGAHTSKELVTCKELTALRWNVRHLEIQRLLGLGSCWTTAGSHWFRYWCLQNANSIKLSGMSEWE